MVGFKNTLCALLLTIFTGVMVAQNNTNSPYTRYGYGNLSDQSFGNGKAMGGIGIGLRDGSQINPLNPASYTAIDSLTFLFEGGITLQNANISAGNLKQNAKNSSFDYLAMQFRLRPWMAMSVGLLPYSSVGYSATESLDATLNTPASSKTISGDGGLHQLYGGLGVKVLPNLSLGVNISYFWGDIDRNLTMLYPANSAAYSYQEAFGLSVSDYKLDFGAQYTQMFGKKHSVTVGATFTPKHNLNNTATTGTLKSNSIYGSFSTNKDTIATFGLPMGFGAGVTYTYDNRLTVGADYSLEKWGDVTYMNEKNAFCDRTRVSVGAEYLPNLTGKSYFAHVKYRLGAYYTTPYYKIEGKRASSEYGISGGFGLPIPRSRSILSLSAAYVRVKGLETNMVNENIFRVSIGLTINERWFFKRKVD